MDYPTEAGQLNQTIAVALAELGGPHSTCRGTTLLIRDGYCAGQRFLFDDMEAVWLIAQNVVHIRDENGRLLRSVTLGAVDQLRAA